VINVGEAPEVRRHAPLRFIERDARHVGDYALDFLGGDRPLGVGGDLADSARNSARYGRSQAWQKRRKIPNLSAWPESPRRGILSIPHTALWARSRKAPDALQQVLFSYLDAL
jgi:hypothetical protein